MLATAVVRQKPVHLKASHTRCSANTQPIITTHPRCVLQVNVNVTVKVKVKVRLMVVLPC